ncbi:MAG: dynamin family protein [Acidimicrobiia bacterium]
MPHDLASAAQRLAWLCRPRWPDLAERLERATARHRERRFHIAVVGEFERGKSTLVNALLERDLMATGVLPLTAVATAVGFGEPSATDAILSAAIDHVAAVALERITLERRAAALDAATLESRAAQVAAAAESERSAFTAQRLLVDDRCRTIADTLAARLTAFARDEPRRHRDAVAAFERNAPLADLDDRQSDVVADEVRAGFDPELSRQRETVESAWTVATERFCDVTQGRVDAIRTAAGELFALPLRPLTVPHVREQIDRFSYLFLPPPQ